MKAEKASSVGRLGRGRGTSFTLPCNPSGWICRTTSSLAHSAHPSPSCSLSPLLHCHPSSSFSLSCLSTETATSGAASGGAVGILRHRPGASLHASCLVCLCLACFHCNAPVTLPLHACVTHSSCMSSLRPAAAPGSERGGSKRCLRNRAHSE